MSTQSGREFGVVDTGIESALHSSIHLFRRRNLIASPLLHLPTELILKVFAHAIEPDDDNDDDNRGPFLLVLTAICHQLREIGIASPQLWRTVDLTTPLIAKVFLERCEYEPHTITKFMSASEAEPMKNPRGDALWDELQGRRFNKLRSIVFGGPRHELTRKVVGILQNAPNISNLDLYNLWSRPSHELPWPISDPIPKLSTLRLSKFSISWTSALLRDLTQLVLDFPPARFPSERTSIKMFLTALANCPNLEIPDLAHAGPELVNGNQEKCDTVVQLRRLRKLSLEFRDPSRVGYILSHVGYPESTKLEVYVLVSAYIDPSQTISQVLPHRNAQTTQHFDKSTALTIYLDDESYFSTDNVRVHFQGLDFHYGFLRDPQFLPRFASKILEIVGGDTITSLNIEAREIDPPDGMWEVLLHGLPRLERICYDLIKKEQDSPVANSFVLVFSKLFEGSPVYPHLRRLELSKGMLAHDASVTALKRALMERDACGRRLKRMGLSGTVTEAEDGLVLEQFRDLVDEVQ